MITHVVCVPLPNHHLPAIDPLLPVATVPDPLLGTVLVLVRPLHDATMTIPVVVNARERLLQCIEELKRSVLALPLFLLATCLMALKKEMLLVFLNALEDYVKSTCPLIVTLAAIKGTLYFSHFKIKVSCRFAFVSFEQRLDAEDASFKYNGYMLEGRKLRIDWDIGVERKDHLKAPLSPRQPHSSNGPTGGDSYHPPRSPPRDYGRRERSPGPRGEPYGEYR